MLRSDGRTSCYPSFYWTKAGVADRSRYFGPERALSRYSGSLSYLPLQSVRGEVLDVPIALLRPIAGQVESLARPEKFLQKYMSSSGTAFGCSFHEALLHALNEIAERYCLSQLYLGLIGRAKGFRLSGARVGLEGIRLSVASNGFGGWFAFCQFSERRGLPLELFGAGSSMGFEIAVNRAMSELFQLESLYNSDIQHEDEAVNDLLHQIGFGAICNLDVVQDQAAGSAILAEPLGVKQQCDRIIAAFEQRGYDVFYHQLTNSPEQGWVVQIYVPGLDRFHLIRSGQMVVPNHVLMEDFI